MKGASQVLEVFYVIPVCCRQHSKCQNGHLFSRIAPAFAGIKAPSAGAFFFLKSSAISAIVTNSTPSCFLKCSISLFLSAQSLECLHDLTDLSCINIACGLPDTCQDFSLSIQFCRNWPFHRQVSILDFRIHKALITHVRMNCNRKDELVVLSVEVIKMIPPDVLDIAWVDEAMTIWCSLDEHPTTQ